MKFLAAAGWTALLAVTALGQKKEQFVEMQRDIALLSDQLKTIEKSQNDKLDALQRFVQQAIDNQGKITAAIATLQSGFAAQQKALTAPVATIGSKVDEMSTEVGSFREQLAEINASLKKMQAQLTDTSNAIKILQAPPAAPMAPDANSPPPGMTAQSLYDSARQAKSAGQFDLAAQQFTDYLRFYPQTELASNAEFYLGEIHYSQQRYDEAIKSFDTVLEKYPDGNKTLDAMYMKGMSLARMDNRTGAATEFRALIKKSPTSEQAAKARDQLKRLTPATPARKK